EDAPKLPSYQTGEEVYWNNGEDVQYAYSKLTPDELLLEEDSKTFLNSGLTNNAQITEETQDLLIYVNRRIPSALNFKLTTNPQRGQDQYPHYPTQKPELHRFWVERGLTTSLSSKIRASGILEYLEQYLAQYPESASVGNPQTKH
ncbi:24923_t:CDS:2, partial [Gigaspora margarita]